MQIKVPELGESIEEAEVVRILVGEGDRIEAEQAVLELEADKASIEMPSPEAGRVEKVLVDRGDRVTPGQAVLEIGEAEEGEAEPEPEADEEAEPEAEAEAEAKEEPEAEAEPEPKEEAKAEAKPAPEPERKAEPEKRAKPEGKAEPERKAEPGRKAEPERKAGREREGEGREAPRPDRILPASPATRRFAREVGVELEEVAPEVTGDRITRGDVMAYLRKSRTRSRAPRREPLSRLRRTAARRLAEAWREVPLVTHHDRAAIDELEAARRRIREREPELPLTITALVAKAAALALRAEPKGNASLDLDAGELVVHRAVHLGVAVDTERGLLVPVVRDADLKSCRELAVEIAELAERARDGALEPGEMRGATFSVTNLGGIGGTSFTPIVNPPEVAILGLSRAAPELSRGAGGELAERLVLPLSLSYDHRALDGADAARLTARIARLLESPLEMLLEC